MTTAIKQRVVDNIGTVPLANIQFPNQVFDPPDESIYAKLNVLYAGRVSAEVDGGLEMAAGRCVIEIVSPLNVSTEEHDDVCDEFLNIFSGVDVGALRFETGEVRTGGHVLGRYRSNVVIEFSNYVEV